MKFKEKGSHKVTRPSKTLSSAPTPDNSHQPESMANPGGNTSKHKNRSGVNAPMNTEQPIHKEY